MEHLDCAEREFLTLIAMAERRKNSELQVCRINADPILAVPVPDAVEIAVRRLNNAIVLYAIGNDGEMVVARVGAVSSVGLEVREPGESEHCESLSLGGRTAVTMRSYYGGCVLSSVYIGHIYFSFLSDYKTDIYIWGDKSLLSDMYESVRRRGVPQTPGGTCLPPRKFFGITR